MSSRHPLILFTLDKRFYFFNFILEVLVYLHQTLYGLASVYNGRMVAFCDELTNLGHGMVRILLGQEHGNLSCLDNLAFAALGLDSRFGPNTFAALVAFQKAMGLEPDGECGEKSWAALIAKG